MQVCWVGWSQVSSVGCLQATSWSGLCFKFSHPPWTIRLARPCFLAWEKPKGASTFQDPTCFTSANSPLTNVSHFTEPRIKSWKSTSASRWGRLSFEHCQMIIYHKSLFYYILILWKWVICLWCNYLLTKIFNEQNICSVNIYRVPTVCQTLWSLMRIQKLKGLLV